MNDRERMICEIFDELETERPAKSTEWLIAMTIDVYAQRYAGRVIDEADVAHALYAQSLEGEKP